jgi:hypothetical protein
MTDNNNEIRNTIVLTLNGQDHFIPMDRVNVNIDSNTQEILDAVEPFAVELGTSLMDNDEYTYSVMKMTNSNNVHVFPKPEAGI